MFSLLSKKKKKKSLRALQATVGGKVSLSDKQLQSRMQNKRPEILWDYIWYFKKRKLGAGAPQFHLWSSTTCSSAVGAVGTLPPQRWKEDEEDGSSAQTDDLTWQCKQDVFYRKPSRLAVRRRVCKERPGGRKQNFESRPEQKPTAWHVRARSSEWRQRCSRDAPARGFVRARGFGRYISLFLLRLFVVCGRT